MEIRTCEEYVVSELMETKENLMNSMVQNSALSKRIEELEGYIKLFVNNLEHKEYCGRQYYRYDIDERDYSDKANPNWDVVCKLIEEFGDNNVKEG